MLKKLICTLLTLSILFALCACGGYDPVPSTDEEARVVMTFQIGNEKYEMKYELYRTLFLTYKTLVDGGDSSVWQGEKSAEYIERIDEMIINSAADIYAVFHIAKKIGKDPFSNKKDEQIKSLIKASVDGGTTDAGTFEGFGGDYQKYLDSLTEYYMNYSVSTLVIRYSLAYNDIVDYYKGNIYEEELDETITVGEMEFDESDVLEFYNGDDSVRLLMATLDRRSFSAERAGQIRDKIANYSTETEVKNYILSFTATTEADGMDGIIIGKSSLDEAYYSALTEAAFDLDLYETSEVITVSTGSETRYYILYRTDKTDEYYKEHRADIYSTFVDNEIGKIINFAKKELTSSVTKSSILDGLSRAEISME